MTPVDVGRPVDFTERYELSLREFLEKQGENELANGYSLGRTALHEKVTLLDLLRVHFEVLNGFSTRRSDERETKAGTFLLECLSPFEMAYRGFQESVTSLEQEITVRIRAEKSLRESEEYFRAIINNTLDIIAILGTDGTIFFVSRSVQTVLGHDPEWMIGNNIRDFLHDDDREMVRAALLRIVDSDNTELVEARVRHVNKSWRILQGVGRNLLSTPSVNGLLINCRDITEQRNLQSALDEASEKRARDLREFVASIQRAQEEERQRISRDLHDDICQRLSAMRFHLDVLEDDVSHQNKRGIKRLRNIRKQIDSLIGEVRRISTNLRPEAIDHLGLGSALRSLSDETSLANGFAVALKVKANACSDLDPQTEIALYRIVQEALSNTSRHGNASHVHISVDRTGTHTRLLIRDDGKGFDPDSLPSKVGPVRLGILGMQERARILNGTFSIISMPDRGTTVRVELPLKGREHNEAD
ncbi:MAG TPA: PAS domain S-box protein [Bacteroidota bacterium]